MSPEQTPQPSQPERTMESLGLDRNLANDMFIINAAHEDYVLALYLLEKEYLQDHARDPEFTDTDEGAKRYARQLAHVNEAILRREEVLGYGPPEATQQP